MKNGLDSSQISVVVQGNVCGVEEDSSLYTRKLCKSIRMYFPKAEIILSTWNDQNTDGLEYDILNKSQCIEMTYIVRQDGNVYPNTVNHEIITSLAGIRLASRKYVIKVRSDLIFKGNKILRFAERYNRYSEEQGIRIVKSRIIVLPTYNYRRSCCCTYNICDWIYFGLKEDIENLFDIELMDTKKLFQRKEDKYPRLDDNFGAEQYIWMKYLNKNGISTNIKNSVDSNYNEIVKFEKTIANNLVFVPADKMQVDSQKMPHAGYAAIPMLSQGFYTFSEWKQLYNRYGGGKEIFLFNPVENLVYKAMLFTRRLVKENNNQLYSQIVSAIRSRRKMKI